VYAQAQHDFQRSQGQTNPRRKADRSTIEKLSRSRCYELLKVAESKPTELQPLIEKTLSKQWSIQETKQPVSNALRGFYYDDQGFKYLGFFVPRADLEVVENALLVCQTTEPCQPKPIN
jgi:hypothetical protein